jgi:hypothetical protein
MKSSWEGKLRNIELELTVLQVSRTDLHKTDQQLGYVAVTLWLYRMDLKWVRRGLNCARC